MLRIPLLSLSLALASGLLSPVVQAAPFADAVVSYAPGVGFAAGFTDPSAALGEPSRVTPGMFGGPVDPFDPPYLAAQIVSLGAGGSLTVQFNTPILNSPGHLYGLDFLIFGNAGFDTGPDFNGIANGSLFGHNTGATRVSVSADNVTYYELNPAFAPVVDALFPTDGAGDFQTPVNPLPGAGAFVGQDLAGVRTLYAGSGGGAGFDLAWARDGGGQSVSLASVSFIRIDVLSGKSEIDGLATVVPEPAAGLILSLGAMLVWAVRRGASGKCLWRIADRPCLHVFSEHLQEFDVSRGHEPRRDELRESHAFEARASWNSALRNQRFMESAPVPSPSPPAEGEIDGHRGLRS